MKNKVIINSHMLIVFIIAILIVLSIPMAAFADDEDQTKDGTWYIYSLKDFWENYVYEDIGYHVVEPMEKIYEMESEEPLEIQVVKEENGGSALDHLISLTVNWVYSIDDPSVIYSEEVDSPEYNVTEENGVLTFTFEKERLKFLEDFQRYEFVFNFDDGKAYSLVWATKESGKLVYREEGHVFVEALKLESEPNPVIGSVQNSETEIISDIEPAQIMAEETTDEVAKTSIKNPVIIGCFIVAAFIVIVIYWLKVRKR